MAKTTVPYAERSFGTVWGNLTQEFAADGYVFVYDDGETSAILSHQGEDLVKYSIGCGGTEAQAIELVTERLDAQPNLVGNLMDSVCLFYHDEDATKQAKKALRSMYKALAKYAGAAEQGKAAR